MEIRPVKRSEYDALGAITVDAYTRLDGHIHEPEYEAELADIATRATAPATAVLVAVDGHELLGGVTYIASPDSPMAEHDDPTAAMIRMLAVAPAAQGRGVGEALVRSCVARAIGDGRSAMVLHSTTWMRTAHRLYERIGFVRDTSLDWSPLPNIPLLGFRLNLNLNLHSGGGSLSTAQRSTARTSGGRQQAVRGG